MDDQRLGAAFRAVRIRRGLRQSDVGRQAGVSQTTVHEIEHGRIAHVSTAGLRSVAAALEIRLDIVARLPHGELDHLLNSGHAALHQALATLFDGLPGWLHQPEVSFAIYRERGVIDILAFHPATGSLLVIELKTELVSLEDLLSTMDVRVRHAAQIARERGWHARSVSAWVVFAATDVTRSRVARHRAVLRAAFPADGRAMRAWLRQPAGTIRALSLWGNFGQGNPNVKAATARRVRKRGLEVSKPR